MQVKIPPRVEAFRQQDREERLVDFIRCELGQLTETKGVPFLVVARSGDSPVARAMLCVGARIAELGLAVRVVFSTDDASIDAFTEIGSATPTFSRELRVIRNPRLLEAHEQLIIGSRSVWFGDALRRDPLKRDAFEHFLAGSEADACAAARAFERLWTATAGLAVPSAAPQSLVATSDTIDGHLVVEADESPRPARH